MTRPPFTLAHEQLYWLGLAILAPLQIALLTHLGQNWGLRKADGVYVPRPLVARRNVRASTDSQRSATGHRQAITRLSHDWTASRASLFGSDQFPIQNLLLMALWKFIKLVISGTVQCKTISDSTPLSWFISTEGALRLPMTYDNHPIQPTQSYTSIHI